MKKLPNDPNALEVLRAKALDELARRDLPTYVEVVHNLPCYPHMKQWADALMDDSIKNLLIISPPGHAKTSWISIFFSAWYIGRNQSHHIILASNTAKQAYKPSVAVRSIVADNKHYARLFSQVRPDQIKGWGQDEWFVKRPNEADKDATMFAVGVGGPIIGARANLLILDDVNDQENTSSEGQRTKVWEWVRDSAFSRRVLGARTVCVMTRWHELDLASKFISDPDWTVIHMPAIGFWGKDTALCPEIMPIESLLKIKNNPNMGTLNFEKVYQGNPVVPEGNILKRAWWRRIDEDKMPADNAWEIVIQSWDTAFKEGRENDYCVCVTMARYRSNIFILNMFRKKMEWPELIKSSREQYMECKPTPRLVLVEDAASGQSLIPALKATVAPVIPVLGVKADSDKISRVNAFSGYVESGRVWLPRGPLTDASGWVDKFLDETAGFPTAANDDICDALAHGMRYLTAGDKFERLDSGMIFSSARPEELAVDDGWDELPGRSQLAEFLKELS